MCQDNYSYQTTVVTLTTNNQIHASQIIFIEYTQLLFLSSIIKFASFFYFFIHKAIHKIICMVNKKMFYCLAKMTREEPVS